MKLFPFNNMSFRKDQELVHVGLAYMTKKPWITNTHAIGYFSYRGEKLDTVSKRFAL